MIDIFISWSGPRSGALAEALKKWLPKIVNAFRPWLSLADIDKGTRWNAEMASKLATSKASIICLTPNNLTAQWILFEAGALSKTLENTFVCPLLVGLEPRDVTGPLAQFQATTATKNHMLALIKTLNRALGESAMPEIRIDEAFEVWWPKLESEILSLPPDGPATRPHRTEREMLEELVDKARADDDKLRAENADLRAMLNGASRTIGELTQKIDIFEATRNRLIWRDNSSQLSPLSMLGPINALLEHVASVASVASLRVEQEEKSSNENERAGEEGDVKK